MALTAFEAARQCHAPCVQISFLRPFGCDVTVFAGAGMNTLPAAARAKQLAGLTRRADTARFDPESVSGEGCWCVPCERSLALGCGKGYRLAHPLEVAGWVRRHCGGMRGLQTPVTGLPGGRLRELTPGKLRLAVRPGISKK